MYSVKVCCFLMAGPNKLCKFGNQKIWNPCISVAGMLKHFCCSKELWEENVDQMCWSRRLCQPGSNSKSHPEQCFGWIFMRLSFLNIHWSAVSLANVVVVKVWKELQKVVITEIPLVADSTYSPVRVTKVNRKLNCLWPNFIWILKVFSLDRLLHICTVGSVNSVYSHDLYSDPKFLNPKKSNVSSPEQEFLFHLHLQQTNRYLKLGTKSYKNRS